MDLAGIFDRAIALYAGSFRSFFSIAITAVVPAALVQYVVALRIEPQLDATMRALEHPQTLANHSETTILSSPGSLSLAICSLLFGYLVLAFANAAIAFGVSMRYRDEPASYGLCYRAAIAAWPRILGVVALALLAFVVCNAVGFLAVAVPIAALAVASSSLLPLAIPLGTTLVLLVIAFVLAVSVMVSGCALCDVTIRRSSVAGALGAAVARVCNRRELWRALLCAIALGALGFAIVGAVDLLAVLLLSRWTAAYTAVDTLARAFVAPFTATVLAVYYLDLYAIESAGAREPEPVYAPTRYLSGQERAAVANFLERRESLGPLRRRAIAARLAAPVRARVPAELRQLDDEALLERL